MNRLTLPLLAAAFLTLNACSNEASTSTSDTATTGSTVPEASATDSASMTAPAAAGDTSKMSSMAPKGTADASGPTAPHANDTEFMQSAAHSDQNEIQLSKIALAKGVSAEAKTLANKMIADHTKSTAALKPVAAKAGVTLPTDMDAEHKALVPTMEKLTDKEFETKYLTQMVTDHQKTANTLKAHQTMTKNTALNGWITTTLPVVEEHLNMAHTDSGMKM